MCSPSSSAEPPEHVPQLERFLRAHTPPLGRYGQWFVRGLWSQATKTAYQESLQLLDYTHRYGPGELENACERALHYGLESLSVVNLLLDLPPYPPYPEPDGQLDLSLDDPG
jgi:hypothetical protein